MKIRKIAKTLTGNELGITGSHQYGLLVPKNPEFLDFFPSLDFAELNPSVEFDVYLPQIDESSRVRFIYYNSKRFASGTRDEFRLTRIIPKVKQLGAMPGDAVVFSKLGEATYHLEVLSRNFGPSREFRGGWKMVEEG